MLQEEAGKLQKKMNALVDSLADMGAGTARMQVARRIETLDREQEALRERIREHQAWINQRELTQSEFEGMKQSLAGFATSMDGLGMEQQRAGVRALIRRIVWDGRQAHILLFGAEDGEGRFDFSLEEENRVAAGPLPLQRGEDSK